MDWRFGGGLFLFVVDCVYCVNRSSRAVEIAFDGVIRKKSVGVVKALAAFRGDAVLCFHVQICWCR